MNEIDELWWPVARLGEALEALAREAGLGHAAVQPLGTLPAGAEDPVGEARRWIDWAGEQLGVEVVPIETPVPELAAMLAGGAATLLPYEDARGLGFFVLVEGDRRRPRLLAPDLRLRRVALEPLRAAMCRHREEPLDAEIVSLLDAAGVPAARRPEVRAALLRERLAGERIGPCWMLRLPASAGFVRQLAQARLPRRLAVSLALFALVYGLEIAGWGLVGRAALDGRLEFGWLAAWVLLMVSMVPLRLAGGWLQSTFALDAGRILKSRLLAGALRLDLETVRRLGVGQWLGRVMESQALESLAMSGGLAALVAGLELLLAGGILFLGAAPGLHLALLALWCGLVFWTARRYARRLRDWTLQRLAMTHELVERMVGHRTRLAQEREGRRDAQEDQAMHEYLAASQAMDTAAVPVFAGVPVGWLLVALAALAPAVAAGTAPVGALAVSVGGILLAQRAFQAFTGGIAGLARAGIAWEQVRDLFHAGRDERPAARPFVPAAAAKPEPGTPLVDASGLTFGYRAEGRPVLADASLTIRHGDKLLLEGPSGGGKSTLAALLTGLRQPRSGLLLLDGLDRPTLGDDWHRLATSAPQFHENHVLCGTLGFNLLMGRAWPASEADLREAEELCRELGLGPLLERMPAGLMQRVGETGWQLSHGERSRIFLARALLQRAPLTVMDESFAALDPETLGRCLQSALRRAPTLMVIAHP